MMKKAFCLGVGVVVSIFFVAHSSFSATDYPTKPITIINPSAPGGTLDLQSRTFAAVAEKFLGQPLVVVNKPGAGNTVGTVAGAQAAPDGYTLTILSTGNTNAIELEIANGRVPPFTRQDFITIGSFTMSSTVVVVPHDSPWKTLADLLNDCKAKPGHYAFSSGGLYGGSHLPAEILMREVGTRARHVPYQGGGPALTAVVGKHVDFATQFPSTSIPLAKGNKLRILALQGDKRLKSIPDVPTVKELGLNAEYYSWIGIGVPKKTPMAIVEKLRDVAAKAAKDKLFIDTVETAGDELRFMDGNKLAAFWETESERVGRLITDLVKETSKK
jgi:tripartite-type tricarboxylate transporter receptor subunit TctC